jgi:hypothetical protein
MQLRVLLVTKASGNNFSINAGLSDGVKHFERRYDSAYQPPPCIDNRLSNILTADEYTTVEISRLDADTFIALLRMIGNPLPDIDMSIMKQIIMNGFSLYETTTNETVFYMNGVSVLAELSKFPTPMEDCPTDVTSWIDILMTYNKDDIVAIGKTDLMNKLSDRYLVYSHGIVGLWSIARENMFDLDNLFNKGFQIVIIYNEYLGSIFIYCKPTSNFSFGNVSIEGVIFNGDPKSCKSISYNTYTKKDAMKVYVHLQSLSQKELKRVS